MKPVGPFPVSPRSVYIILTRTISRGHRRIIHYSLDEGYTSVELFRSKRNGYIDRTICIIRPPSRTGNEPKRSRTGLFAKKTANDSGRVFLRTTAAVRDTDVEIQPGKLRRRRLFVDFRRKRLKETATDPERSNIDGPAFGRRNFARSKLKWSGGDARSIRRPLRKRGIFNKRFAADNRYNFRDLTVRPSN